MEDLPGRNDTGLLVKYLDDFGRGRRIRRRFRQTVGKSVGVLRANTPLLIHTIIRGKSSRGLSCYGTGKDCKSSMDLLILCLKYIRMLYFS